MQSTQNKITTAAQKHKHSAQTAITAFVIALICTMVLTACTEQSTGPAGAATTEQQVRVGVMLPLSGELAVTGEKIARGVRLAQAEYPNTEFIIEDTGSSTTGAVAAAQKLLAVDNVDVLVGPYGPDQAIAVAPIAQRSGVTVFSFSFCSESFKEYDNLLCGYPGAAAQLNTIDDMLKSKEIRTMALIDQNSDFGQNSRAAMQAKADTQGFSIVLDELVQGDDAQQQTVATKVLAAHPDAVFIATDDPADALRFAKQLSEAGFNGVRITFVDVDDKYLQMFGDRVNGTYAPGIAPSAFSEKFTQAYSETIGQQPDYPSALGYDMIHVATDTATQTANQEARRTAPDDAIAYRYNNPAISGFSFLSDRTVSYKLELWQAIDGHYTKAPQASALS